MAISEAQKVDYLWKKLGYGKTKTDIAGVDGGAGKFAANEAIASPLLLRGDKVWNQANAIPASLPGASADPVTLYTTPAECTEDNTSPTSRTWKTSLTDWIPPEFHATYSVAVYIHTAGNAGSAVASGTLVGATGSGNNDEFFFDYQSGVLHFIGTNLPDGVNFTGKSVYIKGARYTGTIGVQNNVADTGNFTLTGSTINQEVTNANFTLGTSGTGKYLFSSDTGIVLPTGNTAARPDAEEGIIRYNTQTAKYEVSEDGSTWTNLRTEAVAGTITKDIFSGDGSTTSFTMSLTPTDENNIVVYIDGVMQEPDQNYTLSGTTINFGEGAHVGARISVMHGFAD
jgi:hypothetical protein